MAIEELVPHKYETDSHLVSIVSWISVKYRKDHNLSLGDCYCLGLGKHLGLPVYTCDNLWDSLDKKIGVEINFIR